MTDRKTGETMSTIAYMEHLDERPKTDAEAPARCDGEPDDRITETISYAIWNMAPGRATKFILKNYDVRPRAAPVSQCVEDSKAPWRCINCGRKLT